jgi:6-phosphofructokinase 1
MEKNSIKKVGIFTSGGDAPAMNASIRSVVRACIYYKLKPYAIMRGYKGMIEGDIRPLKSSDVSNILQKGGTILKSARCKEFHTVEGRKMAYNQLQKKGISALIALGGNGTFQGMEALSNEYDISCVGIPSTIDNDIYGTDYTIGFDTAVNTAISAIDKIRDTAFSHDRVFFVEVMGNNTGYIAIRTGISTGAELVVIPEKEINFQQIMEAIKRGKQSDKTSFFVVIAEGNPVGDAFTLAQKVQKNLPSLEVRVSVLGHIQRGGTPTARDRMIASRLGIAAVKALMNKKSNIIVGIVNEKVQHTSFHDSVSKKKPINVDWLEMLRILSV